MRNKTLSAIPFVLNTAPAVGRLLTCGIFYSLELLRRQTHYLGFFKILKFGRDTTLEWISPVVKKSRFYDIWLVSRNPILRSTFDLNFFLFKRQRVKLHWFFLFLPQKFSAPFYGGSNLEKSENEKFSESEIENLKKRNLSHNKTPKIRFFRSLNS